MYKITFDTYNEDYVMTLQDALDYWKTGVSVYEFVKCDDSGVEIENFPRYWVEKELEWRDKNPYLVNSYQLAERIKAPTKAHLYTLKDNKMVYSGVVEMYAIKNGCVQLKIPKVDWVCEWEYACIPEFPPCLSKNREKDLILRSKVIVEGEDGVVEHIICLPQDKKAVDEWIQKD